MITTMAFLPLPALLLGCLFNSIGNVASSSANVLVAAFVSPLTAETTSASCSMRRGGAPVALSALTERQIQFWEDVDVGVDDIAAYYESKGQSLDRIRAFGRSARGETPPPRGSAAGHQPSEENVDGLAAKPFWDVAADPDSFPWATELEAKAHIIIEEFEANLAGEEAKDDEGGMFSGDSAWQSMVMGKGWSAVRLQRLGVWNAENCRLFPKTAHIIQSLDIPLAVRGVCFARQAPGSGVQPHSDGRNFILTSHLGLKIPEGCWIQVGDERRTWEVGKLTTLDTSFEHSTGNPSDSDRHVLIIDFWHPDLSEAERKGLTFVYDLRNKFEQGDVPLRKPRKLLAKEEKGMGFAAIWNTLTGGGDT